MGKKAKVAEEPLQRQTPAITPEGRRDQMIAYATELSEQRMLNGTASSQEIVFWLKEGSSRLERQKLEEEIKLLKAKTESIKADRERDIMYAQAIEAMRRYTPHSADEI